MLVLSKRHRSTKAVRSKAGKNSYKPQKIRKKRWAASHKVGYKSYTRKRSSVVYLPRRRYAKENPINQRLEHESTAEGEEQPSVKEEDQKHGGHTGHGRSPYDRGFDAGYYEGGEGILAQMIPVFNVLPDMDVREVIQLGLGQVQHLLQPLVDPFTIYREMQSAIESKQPMSLVRLGDGEMLTLAHDLVISTEQARADGPFLSYAGVNLPDHHGRTLLADSIKRATIVGIPISRMRNFQGLLFPALRAHGIDYRHLRMTLSTINYLFYQLGYLSLLLEGRRVLLVGNEAPALAPVLAVRGISIVGIVTPVHGIGDVDRVIGEIAQHSFDIALVAAGIPAVIISERIATELGRVAIDFGHLADKIAKGQPI